MTRTLFSILAIGTLSSALLSGCTAAPTSSEAKQPDAHKVTTSLLSSDGGKKVYLTKLDGQPLSIEGYASDGLGRWVRDLPFTQGYGPIAFGVKRVNVGKRALIEVHYLSSAKDDSALDARDRYDFTGNLVQKLRTPAEPISY